MKLLWTPEAIRSLSQIEDFISRDNVDRAIDFINQLMEQPNVLLKNPELGRIVPELSNESIREIIYKNYRIVYRVGLKQIEILTIFEGHRLFREDDFKKRPNKE